MTGPCKLICVRTVGISLIPTALAEDDTQVQTQTHDHSSNNNV